MELRDHIISAVKDYSLTLGETQLEQLEKYYELLGDWNKKINLTAITDPEGVAVKHFADSLSLLNYTELKQGALVIDIGTGAGFPGVVLKIARPDIELCLLDSLVENERSAFPVETIFSILFFVASSICMLMEGCRSVNSLIMVGSA